MVRVIQARSRHRQEDARVEVDRRVRAYQTTGGRMAEALIAAADEAASRLTEKAAAPPMGLGAGGLAA
jgi:hypothetical protein